MTEEVRLDTTGVVSIADRVVVHANPARDLHGPCVIRSSNGDLLLCHQDSDQHRGGAGFVHQWRSVDNGFSWRDEGPAADWRSRGIDALFGEYVLAADGSLVMIVQRRKPLSDDEGIIGSWVQKSDDHGVTWSEIGPMDETDTYAVMFARSPVIVGDCLCAGVWSRLGNSVYVSRDNGVSWTRRSVIFPVHHPGFETLKDAGPPFYPHVIPCPDDSMLALTFTPPPRNHCYSRRSDDQGHTWEPVIEEVTLDLWAPRMRQFDHQTLIVTGRNISIGATEARFSTDSGRNWVSPLVIDRPRYTGSYAYTDSVCAGDNGFWVFTSSPQSEGKGDIVGVLLKRER